MRKTTIYFGEIHVLNFPIAFFLSIWKQVVAFQVSERLVRLSLNRVNRLNVADHFNWDDSIQVNDIAYSEWARFVQPKLSTISFKKRLWFSKVKELDFSQVSAQFLRTYFIRFSYFNAVARLHNQKLSIVPSAFDRILLPPKLQDSLNSFWGFFNAPLDVMYHTIRVTARGFFLAINHLRALFSPRLQMNSRAIKYFWDGNSPRELSISKDKNTFGWIIGGAVKHEEVFFRLPRPDLQMKAFSITEASQAGFRVAYNDQCLRYVTRSRLVANLLQFLWSLLIGNSIFLPTAKRAMFSTFLYQVYKSKALIDYLKPRVYIDSFSSIGFQDAITCYCQQKGIASVMWAYGVNSYLFSTRYNSLTYKRMIYSNIASEYLVVWNRHFADFIQGHIQQNLEVKILGPLMPGDETAMTLKRSELCKIAEVSKPSSLRGKKVIAVFDVSAIKPAIVGRHPGSPFFPFFYELEYNEPFLDDVLALLDVNPDIFLLYKPKRSLVSGQFMYSQRMLEIFEILRLHKRAHIVDYNINPWVPIALSDLSINMPFESPAIACLQYSKPAIFHDPMGWAKYSRYHQRMNKYITNSRQHLVRSVKQLLKAPKLRLGQAELEYFANGGFTSETSTERFRELLHSLSN